MVRTEAPALGDSRRQQLLPLPLSTAPAPDPTANGQASSSWVAAEPRVAAIAHSSSDGVWAHLLVAPTGLTLDSLFTFAIRSLGTIQPPSGAKS